LKNVIAAIALLANKQEVNMLKKLSLSKLQRSVAYCLHFCCNSTFAPVTESGPTVSQELQQPLMVPTTLDQFD